MKIALCLFLTFVLLLSGTLVSCDAPKETASAPSTSQVTRENASTKWKKFSDYQILDYYNDNSKLERVTREDVASAVKKAINNFGTPVCKELGIDCSVTPTTLSSYDNPHVIYRYYRGIARLAGYYLESKTENILCGMLSECVEDWYTEKYYPMMSISGDYSDEYFLDCFYIFVDSNDHGYSDIADFMRENISKDTETRKESFKNDFFIITGSAGLVCVENGSYDGINYIYN